MTKRFVLYMVIMAGTIYLSLLYDGSVIRFLIAFELILPAILLVLLIMQKKYVEVTLKIPSNVVGKNDNINDTTPPKNMEIHFFPGVSNEYYLYEDDGGYTKLVEESPDLTKARISA